MLRLQFDPKLLGDLIGLPERYVIRAIEWREEMAQYIVYACDGNNDADIIVDIEKPVYVWRSDPRMKLPEGV